MIHYDSKVYMVFNVLITCLCLISSYYYASLVGFRYSSNGDIDIDFHTTTFVFEGFFLVHFITQFFLEYKKDGELPVNDPFSIANNYFNNTLLLDLLCLIPF